MITANNGILIVALTFIYGLHAKSPTLVALAFAMAGLSYLGNLCDDRDLTAGRNLFAWMSIAAGGAAYVVAGLHLLGGL